MNEALKMTYVRPETPTDFKHLPTSLRVPAAERKYAEAVALYAASDLSIRRVAEQCGVTAIGLSAHLGKHHRDLLFARYGLDVTDKDKYSIKVKPPRGQSLITHRKYKEAIEACGDIAYIEYNVSQVARLFNLNGTGLASQLRVHYPEIIPTREKLRQRLGIADNTHRGPRQRCIEGYADALEMYRDTDMTIPEVAERCHVSKSGFCQFMRFYHKDILAHKSARRKEARKDVGVRKPGKLAGNGNTYGPKPETVALYAQALELYRNTSMTIDEIVEKTGVPDAAFKGYLHRWHRGEKLRRRGYDWDGEREPDLQGTKQFLKSTAAKYAPAIASLKENPRHVAEVAKEFGLHPEVFRQYLKMHEPELAKVRGMARLANGRLVKLSSFKKYAQAIHEYATTGASLKSIAERHGLVYKSLMNFILRNCPEERESHIKIVEASIPK